MEALLVLLFTIFSLVFQPAEAYSFGVGDGLAIVFFLAIGVVAVCALLGWVARKRAGQ